jgi:hypothetical protein
MIGLMSPSPSLKRSFPTDGSFDSAIEQRQQKMVKHHHKICYKQHISPASTLSTESVEEQTERALILALKEAGFDAASEPALKAFREAVETCRSDSISVESMN